MSAKKMELYNILSCIQEMDDLQFDCIVNEYGENIVYEVIKILIKEDKNNYLKFLKYITELNLRLNNYEMDSYDYYLSDISMIDSIEIDTKDILIEEIIQIINKLNELFVRLNCNDDILGKNKKPWINDKVEFCINNCDDKNVLKVINNLYNKYVIKRNILVESNLKFVIMIAKKYIRKDGLSMQDLIQYGNIGLIRAIETYDLKFDVKFLTYADRWINQVIRLNIKNTKSDLRAPLYLFDINVSRVRAIDYLSQQLGRIPTNKEVADYTGISLDKIELVVNMFSGLISLDEPVDFFNDGREVLKRDFLLDENANIEEETFGNFLVDELNEFMLDCLTEKEIFILRHRFGFDGDMTFDEIASLLGISYQRVEQLQKRALKKLRNNPKANDMLVYLR